MTDVLCILGSRLRSIRQLQDISQEELADRCGFDRTYISMIERGKRNITILNLTRIAAGLGTSVSALTEGLHHGSDPD